MPFSKRSHFAIFGLAICLLLASDDKLAAKTELRTETELSTNDVLSVMNDKDWILVDTRATDAYNGWALAVLHAELHVKQVIIRGAQTCARGLKPR